MENKKRRWILWVIIAAAACAVVIIVLIFTVGRGSRSGSDFKEHMDAGAVYMDQGKYEEAVLEFTAAIDIDPNEVEPYRMLADAYKELSETDMAEVAYDDAMDVIVTAYETSDLPDGSEELYLDAITYYGEKGDSAEVEKLADEITVMLTDNEEKETIEQLKNSYTDSEAGTGESAPPSEEEAKGLLETFKYWGEDMLSWCYSSNEGGGPQILADYETISADEAYSIAALALREDADVDTREWYIFLNGIVYTIDDYFALGADVKQSAGYYVELLSTPDYEEYLRNIFGDEYSLDDFAEYQDEVGETVFLADDGSFCVTAGDYVNGGVDVAVEAISDTPNDEGFYTIIADYTVNLNDGTSDSYFMEYMVAPDDESEYGFRVAGMVPAGDGVLDSEFASLVETYTAADGQNTQNAQDSQDTQDTQSATGSVSGKWEDIYADYIEIMLDYETESLFNLAYINGDDIPEILMYDPDHDWVVLLNIQDSTVEEWDLGNAVFAERGGYIYTQTDIFLELSDFSQPSVEYLDDNNELNTIFSGEENKTKTGNGDTTDAYKINGTYVRQEEYIGQLYAAKSWMTSGEYNVLTCTSDGLSSYKTSELVTPAFAIGADEAVAALRSGTY